MFYISSRFVYLHRGNEYFKEEINVPSETWLVVS